jgi:hypothetical protein
LQHALDAVALVEPVDLLPLKAVVHDSVGAVPAAAGRIDEAVAAVEYALTLHERKGNTVSAGAPLGTGRASRHAALVVRSCASDDAANVA